MEVARYGLWSPDRVSNQQLSPMPNVELFMRRTKVSQAHEKFDVWLSYVLLNELVSSNTFYPSASDR